MRKCLTDMALLLLIGCSAGGGMVREWMAAGRPCRSNGNGARDAQCLAKASKTHEIQDGPQVPRRPHFGRRLPDLVWLVYLRASVSVIRTAVLCAL
jgi:hypothetical protein